eukprot:3934526-Rhodomonas_salina.4
MFGSIAHNAGFRAAGVEFAPAMRILGFDSAAYRDSLHWVWTERELASRREGACEHAASCPGLREARQAHASGQGAG